MNYIAHSTYDTSRMDERRKQVRSQRKNMTVCTERHDVKQPNFSIAFKGRQILFSIPKEDYSLEHVDPSFLIARGPVGV